jgi:hypothetical protein
MSNYMRVQVTVPAGEYVLGDPSYSMSHDDWTAVLKTCDNFRWPIGQLGDADVLAFTTHSGDGTFDGPNGSKLGVDRGLIGLVPVTMPGFRADRQTQHLTTRVQFDEPTVCERRDNGLLIFGEHRIRTNGGPWVFPTADGVREEDARLGHTPRAMFVPA